MQATRMETQNISDLSIFVG